MVMTASDTRQVPAVRNDVTYQVATVHNTSLWCVLVVTITTGKNYQHSTYQRSMTGIPASSRLSV